MTLELNVTENPISREERAKINANWQSISNAINTLYDELQGMAATDFVDLINRLESLEVRAKTLCTQLETFSDEQTARIDTAVANSEAATAAAQTLTNELQAELTAIRTEFDELTADINSRVNQTITQANADIDAAVEEAGTATAAANTAATSANAAAARANTAATNADNAAASANTAATNADAAAERANQAADDAEAAVQAAADKMAEITAQGEAITTALNDVNTALADLDSTMSNAEQLQAIGTYSATTNYKKNNIVEYAGSSYIALKDSVGVTPPTVADKTNEAWTLLAMRGVDGKGSVVSVNGVTPDATGNVTLEIAATWDELQGKPSTFPPADHTHTDKVNVQNPETSGTFQHTGDMSVEGTLTLSQAPTTDMMAATKKYVDDAVETAINNLPVYDGSVV